MLFDAYTKKVKDLPDTGGLTCAETLLLTTLKSKSRFERLINQLPDDWEKKFSIVTYTDPQRVAQKFINHKCSKGSKIISESSVLSIILNQEKEFSSDSKTLTPKYSAKPATYDEYLKRDYDYPVSEDKWKINLEMDEFHPAEFHVDHRLIWIMKERAVEAGSDELIENIPYKYSINIYTPTDETFIQVKKIENMEKDVL